MLRQIKYLVGVGDELLAGDVRQYRPATGCQQNMLTGVYLAVDFNLVRASDAGMAAEQGDIAVFQQTSVNAVEPFDFTVLVADQGLPVKTRLVGFPAKAAA